MARSQDSGAVIEIRALTQHGEFADAVGLQRVIWGFEDLELLPVRFFVVATSVGGQALGAFDGGRMIGFLLAIPGIKKDGKTYLHSHMMGVLREYRNAGIGRKLKLAQRDDAVARGIDLIEWTFDPLETKNAFFNIERLGAIVSRFVLNQYGTTTSKLHAGMPTDRCVAQWWIDRPRLRPAIEATISVPSDLDLIKDRYPIRARQIQARVSTEFLEYLGKGLVAVGFKDNTYLLGRQS